jgi:hypothetical protein
LTELEEFVLECANIVESKNAKFLETNPEKLTAVITDKGDSNMYLLKGMNVYVN